jgi:hypothetical protein
MSFADRHKLLIKVGKLFRGVQLSLSKSPSPL